MTGCSGTDDDIPGDTDAGGRDASRTPDATGDTRIDGKAQDSGDASAVVRDAAADARDAAADARDAAAAADARDAAADARPSADAEAGTDSGSLDSRIDALEAETAAVEAGTQDATTVDATTLDTGARDSAAPDVRAVDATTLDTSVTDTGIPDAAISPDAADACAPTSCVTAGRICGPLANGCGVTLQCGACTGNTTCNATGTDCVCVPQTAAQACPAGRICGTASDGCNGTVSCGTCPDGTTCNGAGTQCTTVCNACPAGQNCGTACGGTVSCGTCPTTSTCNSSNQCVANCVPKTIAQACINGQNCGTASDGCTGTVNCGTCTAPQTCGGGGTANICGTAPPVDPCNPLTGDTIACITSRNKPGQDRAIQCLACATDNGCFDPAQQGGTCEMLTTTAPASCGSVVGTSSAPSDKQVCLSTLQQIFTSRCAATGQETPCLCGATDAGQCLAGTAAPQGPLLPIYTCDLGATVSTMLANFTVPTYGAGMGNAIAGCAAAFSCDCF